MFKNAQGKFDGRIFIGLMMGLGTASGMVIQLWRSLGDSVPPFWLWAIPAVFLIVALSAWIQRRRDHADLKHRLDRSAHASRTRSVENGPST